MDEHEQRAREVLGVAPDGRGEASLTTREKAEQRALVARVADMSRAAVAAERERKGEDDAIIAAHLRYASEIVENEGESQEWQRYARVFANRLRAEADFHATRSAPAASPAQAEQRVSERLRSIAESMVTVWASSTECAACKRDLRRHPHGTVTYKRAADAEPIEVACPVARLRSEADALEQKP